ncbi:tripartite motif-containing protein 2-like [Liolophura sinensis]|uniref:tripartite motif-containing protein 2-like n=1 Tax=Liolophura sinensis TaxID=3198878 RepID=UPI0031583EBD
MLSTMGISVMETSSMMSNSNTSSDGTTMSRSSGYTTSEIVSSVQETILEEPESPTKKDNFFIEDVKRKTGDKLDGPDQKRRLILDEDHFEETFLKCAICRENYDNQVRTPKMLPCHHTFCQSCLLEMFRVECEFRVALTSAYRSHLPSAVKIQCPSCRDSFIIGEEELKNLPKDITVLQLTNFVTEAESCTVSFCPNHASQPLNFFCDECFSPVCSECTAKEHAIQDGHNVMNISEAMKKYSPEIDEALHDLENQSDSVVEARAALETALENLSVAETEIVNDIHATFEKFHSIATQREKDLVQICEREIGRKRQVLEEKLEVVKRHQNNMTSSRDQMVLAKEAEDVDHIFRQHKAIKETLADPVELPTYDKEQFSALFRFESNDQDRALDAMRDFGDVTFETS